MVRNAGSGRVQLRQMRAPDPKRKFRRFAMRASCSAEAGAAKIRPDRAEVILLCVHISFPLVIQPSRLRPSGGRHVVASGTGPVRAWPPSASRKSSRKPEMYRPSSFTVLASLHRAFSSHIAKAVGIRSLLWLAVRQVVLKRPLRPNMRCSP